MEEKELFEKLLNRAYHLLSFRPRSEQEIRLRLRKYSQKEALLDKVVEKLKDLNFINDRDFVRWWVGQRQTARPKGKELIKLEIKRKGVKKEIIDEIWQQEGSLSQVELCRQAAKAKLPRYENLPPGNFRKKMTDYLRCRGFDWETIKSAIDSESKEE